MSIQECKEMLQETGYCRFLTAHMLQPVLDGPQLSEGMDLLRREAAALERDPYDLQGVRHRRYAQAAFLPWEGRLSWYPGQSVEGVTYIEYYQGAFNPDHAHERRRLVRFSDELLDSGLIRALIGVNFGMTTWSEEEARLPLQVGLTMIKLAPTGTVPTAYSTPNALHQDGERYTFAHLVTRSGVEGGENVIAVPDAAGTHPAQLPGASILERFNLETVFEGYAVYDPLVSHHVDHVTLSAGAEHGERCIMLIDFTPMRPDHHLI